MSDILRIQKVLTMGESYAKANDNEYDTDTVSDASIELERLAKAAIQPELTPEIMTAILTVSRGIGVTLSYASGDGNDDDVKECDKAYKNLEEIAHEFCK